MLFVCRLLLDGGLLLVDCLFLIWGLLFRTQLVLGRLLVGGLLLNWLLVGDLLLEGCSSAMLLFDVCSSAALLFGGLLLVGCLVLDYNLLLIGRGRFFHRGLLEIGDRSHLDGGLVGGVLFVCRLLLDGAALG